MTYQSLCDVIIWS